MERHPFFEFEHITWRTEQLPKNVKISEVIKMNKTQKQIETNDLIAYNPLTEMQKKELEKLLSRKEVSPKEWYNNKLKYYGSNFKTVCQRCAIDKRSIHKAFANSKKPSLKILLTLAIGLRLSLEETFEFLSLAGYVLSSSYTYDIIIIFCIKNKIYDVFDINDIILEQLPDINKDQLLGGQRN